MLGFFGPVIAVKMTLRKRGDNEEEPIQRRADGGRSARGRRHVGGRGGREAQSSEPTIYGWRKKFRELAPSDVKRLRALEAKNARLRRLLAERDLDISVLKEINTKEVSLQARREVGVENMSAPSIGGISMRHEGAERVPDAGAES